MKTCFKFFLLISIRIRYYEPCNRVLKEPCLKKMPSELVVMIDIYFTVIKYPYLGYQEVIFMIYFISVFLMIIGIKIVNAIYPRYLKLMLWWTCLKPWMIEIYFQLKILFKTRTAFRYGICFTTFCIWNKVYEIQNLIFCTAPFPTTHIKIKKFVPFLRRMLCHCYTTKIYRVMILRSL